MPRDCWTVPGPACTCMSTALPTSAIAGRRRSHQEELEPRHVRQRELGPIGQPLMVATRQPDVVQSSAVQAGVDQVERSFSADDRAVVSGKSPRPSRSGSRSLRSSGLSELAAPMRKTSVSMMYCFPAADSVDDLEHRLALCRDDLVRLHLGLVAVTQLFASTPRPATIMSTAAPQTT